MMKRILTLVTVSAVVISSCNQSDFKNELTMLDSLEVRVQEIQEKMKTYDPEMLKTYAGEGQEKLNFIANNWASLDTIDRADAAYLSNYKANKKSLKFYGEQIERTLTECDNTLNQLRNLAGDIKKDQFTKEQLVKFIDDEKKVVKTLSQSDSTLKLRYSKILNQHQELGAKVDSFILDMNQRGIR